jgi:hypothetical protein
MENTELKEKYCREFGYGYFNYHNENEYTKWLESELLEALKQVKNNGVLDGVSNRRELLIAFYANQNGGLNNTNKYSIEREVDKYLSNL